MIYFVYGENNFAVRQHASALIGQYKKIISPENIFSFDNDSFSPEDFEQTLRGAGLFGTARLVIAVSLFSKKETALTVERIIPNIHRETILILQEEHVDPKTLSRIKKYLDQITHCAHYSPKELAQWIAARATAKGIALISQEKKELIEAHPRSPWMIDQILERWSLGGKEKDGLTREEPNLFGLLDLVTGRRPQEAYAYFHRLLSMGVSYEEIFWRIYWQWNVLRAISFLKHENPAVIKQETGFHPFVIKKGLGALQRFSQEEIESVFEWMIDVWHASKLKTRDLGSELESFILTSRPHQLFSRLL